jgi:hypothetical protein
VIAMNEPLSPPALAPDVPADPPVRPAPSLDEELVMFLERDQFVSDTSVPVPPAELGRPARAALWALRIFVLVVSAMVIVTFVASLR